ncbi:MAG TPA: sigma-E factor regulatory protein RseB domain-containing protein [Fimbriimonas sp.]|nr:sigma-E factor regulatory protein RseB domain-containing protein [Fimbriimonas sp.]
MVARRIALCIALGATVLACASDPNWGERDAFRLYTRSLEKANRYNVSALISQRDPQGGGWEVVQVERDKDGHVHKSVIQPLAYMGIESVDDGERWQTYLPDQRVILDQESSLKHSDFAVQRLKLASKNYRFSLESDSFVAGRKAYCVVARPTHDELFSHRLYLDQETLYPLRAESFRGNELQIEFFTKDVAFPSRMDPGVFVLHNTFGVKRITLHAPVKIMSAKQARKELGFGIVMPKGLPYGFMVQEMQLSTDNTWHALVVRLSDGLARATVYEYPASESGISVMEHSSVRVIGDVKLQIVSELDEKCREALLDTFEDQLVKQPSGHRWDLLMP